ncbi:MAG: hypothetical protein JRC93_04035 [Deltaproteobacteria bacterium]|nr:hypothetical protein [Deltaproteobacteria bacterium]
MAIGVSYEDFWHGDPEIVSFAIEVDEIQQRNGIVRNDFLAWNTGRYVMAGVGVVLSQAFSKTSKAKYPAEPLIAAELDEQLAEQKRERELVKAQNDFLAVAAALSRTTPNQEYAVPNVPDGTDAA